MKLSFPPLFEIALKREVLVEDVLVRQNMGNVRKWDVQYQCGFNDWEVELVGIFLHQLELHIPLNGDEDRLKWKLKKNGDLDIHSFFSATSR